MGTNRWLRMIVYERVTKYSTILTYALSAVWHGFYPGYYLLFASASLYTITARVVRRHCREYFTHGLYTKLFYDIVTCVVTRLVMAYNTFSFVLLEFWPSIRLYLHMYMCLHILTILTFILVPRLIPQPVRRESRGQSSVRVKSTTENIDATISNGSLHTRALNTSDVKSPND